MRTSVPALAALLIAAATSLAEAQQQGRDCIVSATPATFGVNSQGSMEINSGEQCNLYLRLSGTIESAKIIQRPKYGSLSMSDLSSAVYKSKAGYRGVDEFAFQLSGNSMTGKGTSVIRIRANVK
jgi:hypothetical protein